MKVGLNLAKKPSGCVIWIFLNHDLGFNHFRWFGEAPGKQLLGIGKKIAKPTKGNVEGPKVERVAHRVIHRNKFQKLEWLEEVPRSPLRRHLI